MPWNTPLTRPRACLLICLLWAGIYLPALGTVQLKHEEPRRALPALRMLETGDWLVPRVGADVYLRKPPLLNWLIALSFRANGDRGEFAARLPSVLAMLAVALTVVVAGARWLGTSGALLAAIFLLTNFAALDTGRLAELEALYLSVTGIALTLWLILWRARAGPWLLWCAPAPFLALGMLTKGPAHLLFFYGVAVAVLVAGKDRRALLHPAHAVALVIMFAPVLAWAIPCAVAVGRAAGGGGGPGAAWAFWWREISSRAAIPEGTPFSLSNWLLRVPQGFANFMPWTVLLPLLWRRGIVARFAAAGDREWALFRGARWGMVTTFLVISLLPGSSARYAYPLLVVPCLLLGRALTIDAPGDRAQSPAWLSRAWRLANLIIFGVIACAAVATPFFAVAGASVVVLVTKAAGVLLSAALISRSMLRNEAGMLKMAIGSAAALMLIIMLYAVAVVPLLNRPRPDHLRETAAAIRAKMPPGKRLGVLDEGYRPFWYYLEPGVVYFHHFSEIPPAGNVDYFLVPASGLNGFNDEAKQQGAVPAPISETMDGKRETYVLLMRASG